MARTATGQRVGYVRVSTFDQNVDRQLEGVSLDRCFTDRVSGNDTNRPELTALLAFVREGDTVMEFPERVGCCFLVFGGADGWPVRAVIG